tara:strand:+ start:94 stop:942 length:849 start_codon:yes stop_codon:yes gene_type:complete
MDTNTVSKYKSLKKFRLISFDIDGTLRDQTGKVSTYLTDVLLRCKSEGAMLTAATGRSRLSAISYVDNFPMFDFLISFQGALITDLKTEKHMWESYMTPDQVSLAVRNLHEWDVDILVYVNDFIYVSKVTDWAKEYSQRNKVKLRTVEDLSSIGPNVFRVLAVGDEDIVQKIEIDMNLRYSDTMYATRSLPNFCEILSNKSGKDKALQWLCDSHEIDQIEVLSFGNGFNDVDMLNWSGWGVAVRDAEFEVIAAANDVAGPVSSDGVGKYLAKLLSQNKIGIN